MNPFAGKQPIEKPDMSLGLQNVEEAKGDLEAKLGVELTEEFFTQLMTPEVKRDDLFGLF